jgi:hypothetical protein
MAEGLRLLDEPMFQPSALPYYHVVIAFMKRGALLRTLEARMGDPDSLSSMIPTRLIDLNAD